MFTTLAAMFTGRTIARVVVLDDDMYARVYFADGTSTVITTSRDMREGN